MVPDRVGPAGVLGAAAAAGRQGAAGCEYGARRQARGALVGRLLSVNSYTDKQDDLYSLDAETLAPLQPIYALIFLFKYVGGGAEDRAGVQVDALDSGVWFANQVSSSSRRRTPDAGCRRRNSVVSCSLALFHAASFMLCSIALDQGGDIVPDAWVAAFRLLLAACR